MLSKKGMAWTAVVVGAFILLTEWLQWNGNLHYLWGVLVILWGAMAFK